MRLLVYGGRDFEKRVWAFERLDRFHAANPVNIVIRGAAPAAATIGEEWAKSRGITFTPYPATQESWDRSGRVHWAHAQHTDVQRRQARPCFCSVQRLGHYRYGHPKETRVAVTFARRL
jgi:YspA, cpYpsA-related SLOG family